MSIPDSDAASVPSSASSAEALAPSSLTSSCVRLMCYNMIWHFKTQNKRALAAKRNKIQIVSGLMCDIKLEQTNGMVEI